MSSGLDYDYVAAIKFNPSGTKIILGFDMVHSENFVMVLLSATDGSVINAFYDTGN